MFRRLFDKHLLLAALSSLALAASAAAAVVTPQVYVTFDGSLAGTSYTLGPGELDNSFTFTANGSVSITDGVADVPGDTDFTSGFYFSGLDLELEQGLGSMPTIGWISEAIISLDVPVVDQPDGPAAGDNDDYNHFLDVRGDTFYRFAGDDRPENVTEFGYWNGSIQPLAVVTDPLPGLFHHVALVWTPGTNTLEAFFDGESQGALSSGAPFEIPSQTVSYGFFSRFLSRAFNGKLDAVAFSTYTGEYSTADFQLPIVPEPSSFALVATVLGGLVWTRKK